MEGGPDTHHHEAPDDEAPGEGRRAPLAPAGEGGRAGGKNLSGTAAPPARSAPPPRFLNST